MQRTISIIGIILFLLLSSLSSNTIGEDIKSTIITVDDDGDGDYTSIQDAIDNASDGDTIYVYSGNYECFNLRRWENFQSISNITVTGINHELNSGDGIGKPIITGRREFDCLIYLLWANNCVIDGFNISSGRRGIHLIDSWNNTIINNTISFCDEGIELEDFGLSNWSFTGDNIVKNNNIQDCYRGIFLEYASRNLIIENTVSNCETGILIFYGKGNAVQYNRLINNGDYDLWGNPYGEGIGCMGDDNVFEMNYFKDNVFGLLILDKNNIVRFNNFYDSKVFHGFFICIYRFIWDSNYYDNWLGIGPKIIMGFRGFIPWLAFDWNPASEPYDIP